MIHQFYALILGFVVFSLKNMPKVAITHEHEMYTKEALKQTENIANPKLDY
jgi:hypothetical protein